MGQLLNSAPQRKDNLFKEKRAFYQFNNENFSISERLVSETQEVN